MSDTTTPGDTTEAAFLAELTAFEGRAIDAQVAPDPVNQAMIRHWVEAMGDTNPVYVDAEAAAASVFGGIVAPSAMLQVWPMQGLRTLDRAPDATDAQSQLLNLLDAHGFSSVVATDSEQEYFRPLRPGDHVTTESVIDSVSAEKATGIGVGHFVTVRIDYLTTERELVGRQRWSLLKFRPGTGRGAAPAAPAPDAEAPAAPRPKRPRPGTTHDTQFFFDGALRHELLIQRCIACTTLRHPPQARCDRCGSYDWDTVTSTGRGEVYSFVVVHHPQVPAFDYPMPIGLIALEEGTRLVAQIVDCDPADVTVGMPVEVTWIDDGDDLSVPAFRPVGAR